MTGDLIPANVLATHTIANVSETLAEKLGLPRQYRSIGIITADSDDVTYCALDEATKAAAVEVVYGRSLYAGAGNASTKLAGEVIGILAGPNPAEVQSGLRACAEFMASGVGFRSANEDGSIVYFAHTVSRTGTYLSKTAGVREGVRRVTGCSLPVQFKMQVCSRSAPAAPCCAQQLPCFHHLARADIGVLQMGVK